MATAHTSSKTFTVDDLWQIERIGGVSLSPDGAQAVCSLSRYDMEANSSSTALWLLSTLGGEARALTHCGGKDGQAAWSPQGDAIAFVARREQEGKKDDTPQLYLIAPDGGEARRISDYAPGLEAFKWFPDGKRIAFISWVWPGLKGAAAQARRHAEFKARKETAYVTSEAQYRHWDHNLPMDRVVHLHVLDVASGRVTDLMEGSPYELPRADPSADMFDIAPDGRRIVFCADTEAQQRPDHHKVLVELTLRGGRFEVIAQAKGWDFNTPSYRPDGEALALLVSNQGKKHTEPELVSVLPRGARWSARSHLLSSDWDHTAHAPLRWTPDGQAMCFLAEDRGQTHLWRFDVARRQAEVLAPGGWMQGFDIAADGQDGVTAVVVGDAMNHPSRASVVRAGEAPRRIESFNDALLATFSFGEHESVTLKGALGDPVQMWVVYPPGFDKRKSYPVMHSIHGGPHAASGDTFHYRWNNQVFAAQGYVVACVNYHGSSGFGQAFLDSITHRWGELELQDVEAGTDWLLEAALGRQAPCLRHRRQLWRLHGGLDERPCGPGPLPGLCVPCRLLRLDRDVQRRRLHLARPRARCLVLGRPGQGRLTKPARLRPAHEDPHAGDPRRAGLPRARPARSGLLQHPQGARCALAAGLVSR